MKKSFFLFLLAVGLITYINAQQKNIIFVTDDDLEDENINFLRRHGFNVEKVWYPDGLGTAGPDTIARLNSADLVIIGRSGASTNFQQQADKEAWNGLTSPLLLLCPWKARSSRMNWFNSRYTYRIDELTGTTIGIAVDPSDPVFTSVQLKTDSSFAWSFLPDNYILVKESSNCDWIVNRGDTIPLLVRFEPNIPFYGGATDSPAGLRTYMGMGSDQAGPVNFFPLTINAQKIYLAEVCRLMNIPVPESAFKIIFISGDTATTRDSANIQFLEDQGYVVDACPVPDTLVEKPQTYIDSLNSAELIVVGWDFSSNRFDATRGRDIWNNIITIPMLVIYPDIVRSTTCNWFKSSSTKHLIPPDYPDTIWSVVVQPADPVFSGLTLVEDTIDWSLSPITYLQLTNETNGEILVRDESLNAVHFVRFDPGVKFYDGSNASAWAAGPRTYFGFGNNSYKIDDENQYNYWTLTENSKAVYLAEIDRLINLVYEPYLGSDDASLQGLTTDAGTLTPDFSPTTYSYDLELKSPVVGLTAVPNEPVATVVGDGLIDLAEVTDSTVIISVISSSTTDTLEYAINISIAIPEIIFITDDDLDDTNVNFLTRQGFTVTKMWFPAGMGASSEDSINMLNAADLVIIGRSGSSMFFRDSADKAAWNGLTVPLMLICPWKARNSRLNWFDSYTQYSSFVPTKTNDGFVLDPNDPIFDDVTLDADNSLIWTYVSDDYLTVLEPFNGTCIVNRGDTIPLLVRFDANIPFYPGANDSAAGPRTYMGMGIDALGPSIFFPLTREAKKVYLAEIYRMMNFPVHKIVYGAPDFSITVVTDDDYDKPCITFLQKQGFSVKTFWPPNGLGVAGQDTIDMLNAEDLVIIGRSGPSTSFQQPVDKAAWNGLTSPLVLNCPWKARSSRLNWFNASISYTFTPIDNLTGITDATAINPDDPVFEFAPGVEASGFIPEWSFKPDDYILLKQSSNGDWIVNRGDSIPLVVRFEPNVPFYPGATDSAAGERVYFGMGNDAVGPVNFFPLTKTGQAVYFAEAMRLLGFPAYEPVYLDEERTLSSLVIEGITLVPAFHKDTLNYAIVIPAGTDSFLITATASSEAAVVSGAGWHKTPILPNEIAVTSTAENGRSLSYMIGLTGQETGIQNHAVMYDNCHVHPNPVNDKVVISATDVINSVTIYNLQGAAMVTRIVDSRNIELSVSNLNAGIYFIKVQSGDNVYVSKITKN